MQNPSRPRGFIWSYRQNTDVRYAMETAIQDIQKKNPDLVVGEVVMTFFDSCPTTEEDIFIEMNDEGRSNSA
jgi:hypothetical protein